MRHFKILGAAFFAVLAFTAISAASAFAAPQWLHNGEAITSAIHSLTEGTVEILIEPSFGEAGLVTCSGFLLGTVGPSGTDSVSHVFGLKGEAETTINCAVSHTKLGPCSGSLLAEVTADNLPWATELLLVAANEIVDHFKEGGKGKPGFTVVCTLSGGTKSSALCVSANVLTKPLVNNIEFNDVDATILEQHSEECSNFLVKASLSGKGLVKALEGTLAVSD